MEKEKMYNGGFFKNEKTRYADRVYRRVFFDSLLGEYQRLGQGQIVYFLIDEI